MSWTEHYTKIKTISQLNVCLIVLFEVEKEANGNMANCWNTNTKIRLLCMNRIGGGGGGEEEEVNWFFFVFDILFCRTRQL